MTKIQLMNLSEGFDHLLFQCKEKKKPVILSSSVGAWQGIILDIEMQVVVLRSLGDGHHSHVVYIPVSDIKAITDLTK